MNLRSTLVIAVILFFTVIAGAAGVQKYLEAPSPDLCGSDLCVTVQMDQDTYSLSDDLHVDVWLSNNGNSIFRDVPTVFDILIANSSQTVMRHLRIQISITGNFQLYPRTKTQIFSSPPIDLDTYSEESGEYPPHSGLFTLVVECRHGSLVFIGNTTFTIL